MNSVNTITIKTQVRRLKYFTIMLNILNSKGTNKDFLAESISNWSTKNKNEFDKYDFQSGEIKNEFKSSNSQSFKNYYEALLKLNLASEQTGFVIPSRLGVVLKKLEKICTYDNDNSYELSPLEKLFFTYIILKVDNDWILTIIKMIEDHPNKTISHYLNIYKQYYLSRLTNKLSCKSLHYDRASILDVINRVKKWTKEKRYGEDIIPSRINWLLDLGTLNRNNEHNATKSFILKKNLNLSLKYLSYFNNDYFLKKDFFQKNFMGFAINFVKIDNQKSLKHWDNYSIDYQEKLLKECIKHCINSFKSLNLKRLSIEQTYLFSQLYLLLNHNLIVEQYQIEKWIKENKVIGIHKFYIRKSARDYESYLIYKNE